MDPASEYITVSFRVCFKVMNTVSPQAKLSAEKGLTILFLTNSRNNFVVPKILKWDDISMDFAINRNRNRDK